MDYDKYLAELQADIIPLDKLISKLKRDLKISATGYSGEYEYRPVTRRKNRQYASTLYWLEKLKNK
jgi:hypothetical protein